MAYDNEFREDAMRLVTEEGYTPTAAARELGVPINTLNQWLKKSGWRPPAKGGPIGPNAPLSDDPAVLKVRIGELEAQLRRARMEKDILKKATAYFASLSP